MNTSKSPVRSRLRLSVRAESKVMLIVIIAIIALSAAALFYQWRSSDRRAVKEEKISVEKVRSGAKKSGDKAGKKKKDKSTPVAAEKK